MVLALAALLIGLSKTGFPGTGVLAVVMVAAVIPARESTGLILPMLIVGDIFAVFYYHRHAAWKYLVRLIPFAVVGIVAGYFLLGVVNDVQLRPIIGGIILVMLTLNHWRNRMMGEDVKIPSGIWFPLVMGLMAGVTTMLANAAGPIMIIYLLAMRLPRDAFLGTGAWYFLLLNCFKVPFSADLGLVNELSLTVNLTLLPVIVIGALLGIRLVKRVPEKSFAILVQVLAALTAVYLLIPK